jgi:hypothetical protein
MSFPLLGYSSLIIYIINHALSREASCVSILANPGQREDMGALDGGCAGQAHQRGIQLVKIGQRRVPDRFHEVNKQRTRIEE